MKILVTGATGFVGKALCVRLGATHQLVAVSRDAERARRQLGGAVDVVPVEAAGSAVDGCDAVVNLAGESIAAGRWTAARKRAILDSRVGITRALASGMAKAARKPSVFISASAVGYYGAHGEQKLDETSPAGDDFLARVCVAWEAETRAAEEAGVRTVRLRLGVVIGEGGGALERMALPFKFYAGGHVGDGRQWLSWIHRDDVIGLIELGLRDGRASGALNATAPEPETMRDFSRTLGKVLGSPSWAPVPGFVLRLALGEMADMLLKGQRVLPAAALGLGYPFAHPRLEGALRDILKRPG